MPSWVLSNCTSSTHEASVRVENSIIKRKMENGKRKSASKREQKHGRDAACSVRERQTKRTLHAASLHPRAGADSRRRSGLKRKTVRTAPLRFARPPILEGQRKWEAGNPAFISVVRVLKNIFFIFPVSAFILRCLLLLSDTAPCLPLLLFSDTACRVPTSMPSLSPFYHTHSASLVPTSQWGLRPSEGTK